MITEQPEPWTDKIKALFSSRRFWAGVAGIVVVCTDTFAGKGTIDPAVVQDITLLIAAWIVGDSLRVTK
tara:strand:- start:86 stop:292 length:207 start_codon:yes stop_codon:yes gene_type:complete